MFIPGIIVSALTFPGVMAHEFSHVVACKLTKTPVSKVCYFRFGNPAGYVIHQEQPNPWRNILIGIGPFIFNSLLSVLLGSIVVITVVHGAFELYDILIIWLALSIGMHSFPSVQDAKNIWKNVWKKESGALPKVVGTPLVGLMFIGSILSIVWLDLLYGILTGYFIPEWIFNRGGF